MTMTVRLGPALLIPLLGLLFFADLVLHPAQVLYSDTSDLLAMHLPTKRFLVRTWQQTGELPRWCPYSFGGTPLVHDVQAAAFYPPHAPLYLLPEGWVGPALSWLVVLHVIAAGWCMLAYARTQGLGPPAALVAAVGYMFGSKWLMHVLGGGHYILAPLAWLPLVLLGLERAVRPPGGRAGLLRRAWCATGAGAAFALIILGTHPQLTLYAGLFAAIWTLGPALEQAGLFGPAADRSPRRTAAALGWWAGLGAWAVLAAVALSAVQLLPALEAAGESSRGVGVAAQEVLRGGVVTFFRLLGPTLSGVPWEDQGGLGVLWVAAAVLAPVLCRGRVRFQAAVGLGVILFAVGGGFALQRLPGFRLFILPSRALLLMALPVALLAGVTTQALLAGPESAPGSRCRRVLLRVLLAALVLVAGQVLFVRLAGHPLAFHGYWVSLLLTVPAAFWLLGRAGRPGWAWAWTAVLLADAWALTWPLVAVRREADVYDPAPCVDYLLEHNTYKVGDCSYRGRVLDLSPPKRPPGTPLGSALPLLYEVEPVLGYNTFDVYRYKQYLQFIAGSDQPVRPREGVFGYPIVGHFPVKNKGLLDLLGTRHLLQPANLAPPGEGWHKKYEDVRPYGFLVFGGGLRDDLPPFAVYENRAVLPRAFTVSRAAPLPDGPQLLPALSTADFRHQVFLEGITDATGSPAAAEEGPALIRNYQPDRVVVEVNRKTPGYLVLADVWFPGWTCTVDDNAAPLYRANFLFRAVPVGAGTHTVVFAFDPASYRLGRVISTAAVAVLLGLSLAAVLRRAVRRSATTPPEQIPV
jgi:hypothetical protein